jgi:hypothetical protein
MPHCLGLVQFFHFGTGLIGCRTVRHSGIYTHEHADEHADEHTFAHAHSPMMNMREHGQEHRRAA